jgi:hypothetical protein
VDADCGQSEGVSGVQKLQVARNTEVGKDRAGEVRLTESKAGINERDGYEKAGNGRRGYH